MRNPPGGRLALLQRLQRRCYSVESPPKTLIQHWNRAERPAGIFSFGKEHTLRWQPRAVSSIPVSVVCGPLDHPPLESSYFISAVFTVVGRGIPLNVMILFCI